MGTTEVKCGEDLELQILKLSPESDCYDFELRIKAEGGETLFIPKSELEKSATILGYKYTLKSVKVNYTVTLVYKRTKYLVTSLVKNGEDGKPHGTITPALFQQPVDCGSSMKFVIQPDPGYRLYNLEVSINNGDPILVTESVSVLDEKTGSCEYAIDFVDANYDVRVTFAKAYFSVKASEKPGDDTFPDSPPVCSISPHESLVEPGGSQGFRIREDGKLADCIDFELRITAEGGETLVIPKNDIIIMRQYEPWDQVYIYTYTLSNIQSDYEVELVYKGKPVEIETSVSPEGGGKITPGGTNGKVMVKCKTDQTFQCIPNKNYRVKQIKLDGNVVEDITKDKEVSYLLSFSGIDYTIENVIGPHTLEAVFQKYYTIKATAGEGGSIDPSDEVKVDEGGSQAFTVSAKPGHYIKSVDINGLPATGLSTFATTFRHTFAEVYADQTIEATFAGLFIITATAGKNGTIDLIGNTMVPEGADQKYTFKPDDCYEVSNVEINGLGYGALPNHTFENVSKNNKIDVTFEKKKFTIKISIEGKGKIEPSGEFKVECGEDIEFKMTPDHCYGIDDVKVTRWSGDPVSVKEAVKIDPKTGVGTYILEDVTSESKVEATFKKIGPFTVTTSVSPNFGTIEPGGPLKVECGATQEFSIHCNDCYEIEDVKVSRGAGDPVSVMKDVTIDPKTHAGIYDLKDITSDCKIEVTFREITFTVTIETRGNGVVWAWDIQSISESLKEDELLLKSLEDKGGMGNYLRAKSETKSFKVPCGHDVEFYIYSDDDYIFRGVKITRENFSPQTPVLPGIERDTFPYNNQVPVKLYKIFNIREDYFISTNFAAKSDGVYRDWGDVDGDGEITAKDAIMISRISVGAIEPTEEEKKAADVNGDGEINGQDAYKILQKVAEVEAPGKNLIEWYSGKVNVTLADIRGISGESVIVPVKLDKFAPLTAGDLCISYDNLVLRAVSVSPVTDTLFAYNVEVPGIVRICFARYHPLKDQKLFNIEFKVLRDDFSPLIFSRSDLYQIDGLPIDVGKINGRFISWNIPAERTELLQNFPNPFNPETWIPYQLKEEGEVTIYIHNIAGALVRELKLGYKPAGVYASSDRAVHWDGKNEVGEDVVSGVYFYTIRADNFTATKKMIIAR
jgi:hypothetical protein